MSKFTAREQIVGILFHDSNSRLCILDDTGKHNVVVESEGGLLSFVDGIMMTDIVTATWNDSPEEELWEAGIYSDLLADLQDEGELHKINETSKVAGALFIRE
jgi:hypothetical protein